MSCDVDGVSATAGEKESGWAKLQTKKQAVDYRTKPNILFGSCAEILPYASVIVCLRVSRRRSPSIS
jgi:hypothetical protein